ncbi:purine nucleoside permease [Pseudooceanicola sp. CBS1P-1]|nr:MULTISPECIES: purine nucleoside permease [Pseudooceanicola]MBT9386281.1 purine nucleoside permease [Pseudooceanicola endophyticus]
MSLKSLLLAGAALTLPGLAMADPIAPKVLVITMFGGEAKPWLSGLDLPQSVKIPGLPADADALHCNADLCEMTTTMGFANAAASAMAVGFSDQVDLRQTYVIIAGIAGVNPEKGTLGGAAWADYVVDTGLVHFIDSREAPADWPSQIVELGAKAPDEKPGWSAGTEVFALNADLVQDAFAATKDVALSDGDAAKAYRALYSQEAAKAAPAVTVCASVSSDTYWHGAITAAEVARHTAFLTDGKADYCMSQMEDNATLTGLKRAAEAGRLDFDRVAVLRTASNFDRAHDGQTTAESLAAKSGGYGPATQNAFLVGNAFAQTIITHWDDYATGVPKP